jgi:hypothetical protein
MFSIDHVEALTDEEVANRFPSMVEKLTPWRKYAAACGYTGPVTWLCAACDRFWEEVGRVAFQRTIRTTSVAFWVPRLAAESTSKTITQMTALRKKLHKKHRLPPGHCQSFGSDVLITALIQAHFKRVGERVPLGHLYAASDTLRAEGGRLILSRRAGGIDYLGWLGDAGVNVGFFLLGVEELP